jgi:hypothetical protein
MCCPQTGLAALNQRREDIRVREHAGADIGNRRPCFGRLLFGAGD